ncbi:MAG: hypothetical protein ACKVT0_09525 [Planctomycetaceae bacterium]
MTVLVLGISSLAQAGGLMPAHVDADAKWVAHLDLEAIHAVPPVKEIREKFLKKERVQEKIEEATEELGMNPAEDILGATLYSTGYKHHKGVAVIYVRKLDREKLLELFDEKHPDHESSEYGDRTLYTWTAEHHHHEQEMTGTFVSDTAIIIGSGIDDVKSALDVIDGKKPGLAGDAKLLAGKAENDLVYFKAVDVPGDLCKSEKHAMLKTITGVTAQWQYTDGSVKAHYEIESKSAENVQSVKAIIDGVKAMGTLRYQELKDVLKVINGLSAEANGTTLTVNFSSSIDDIKAGVKQAKEHHKSQRKSRRDRDDDDDDDDDDK